MDNVNINIKEFDITQLKPGNVSLFIGSRGSGKSFTMRDILYHKRDYPVVRVICETEKLNQMYSPFVPKIFIDYKFDEKILKDLFKRQAKIIKAKRENPKIDERSILIFDDLLASAKKWKNNEYVKKLMMNGRHSAIDFLLSVQYSVGIDPDLRTQFDYIFIFKETKITEREKIYEHFASMIPKYLFNKVFDSLTDDYRCMVIKNVVGKSNNWLDQVFWYKAKERTNFRMCPNEIWELSEKYNSDYESDEEITPKMKNKTHKQSMNINFI